MDIQEYRMNKVLHNVAMLHTADNIKALYEDEVEIPLEETYYNSTYTRTGIIPKDTIIIGRLHRGATLNIVLEGKIIIMIEGREFLAQAGDTFVTPPMTKKLGRTIEDTKFMNVCEVEEDFKIENAKEILSLSKEQELEYYKEYICHLEW